MTQLTPDDYAKMALYEVYRSSDPLGLRVAQPKRVSEHWQREHEQRPDGTSISRESYSRVTEY